MLGFIFGVALTLIVLHLLSSTGSFDQLCRKVVAAIKAAKEVK